jgi:hypothetical protein
MSIEYDKRNIVFNEKPGTLIVKSESINYEVGSSWTGSKFDLQPKVSDNMIIEVVDTVKIEPP